MTPCQATVLNELLVHLELIKSEFKIKSLANAVLFQAWSVLSHVVAQGALDRCSEDEQQHLILAVDFMHSGYFTRDLKNTLLVVLDPTNLSNRANSQRNIISAGSCSHIDFAGTTLYNYHLYAGPYAKLDGILARLIQAVRAKCAH